MKAVADVQEGKSRKDQDAIWWVNSWDSVFSSLVRHVNFAIFNPRRSRPCRPDCEKPAWSGTNVLGGRASRRNMRRVHLGSTEPESVQRHLSIRLTSVTPDHVMPERTEVIPARRRQHWRFLPGTGSRMPAGSDRDLAGYPAC